MGYDKINDLKLHNDSIAGELQEALLRVLASGWFALGPEVSAFEEEFASWCGIKHCIGVANGTDALELVLRGCNVSSGDEVITVANAGMYSSCAILAIGAKPVFADINPESYTICPKQAASLITPRTKAIIATHLYGRLADVVALRDLANKMQIALIEDCAQSHGAALNGKRAGSWGDGAAFSFYPTKNLGALGDGGAVGSNSDAVAGKIRQLRQYGWEKRYSAILQGGRNSRLDELQAAPLRVKLKKLDGWNNKRRELATCYSNLIKHPDVQAPNVMGEEYVAHLYVLRSSKRDALREHLQKNGIAVDVHYPLLDYQQPALKALYPGVRLPESEKAAAEILTLPCYPELTIEDATHVAACINNWKP